MLIVGCSHFSPCCCFLQFIFVQNLELLPPLFILSSTKATYDEHNAGDTCNHASTNSLWQYKKASVLSGRERDLIAELLVDENVDNAYVGAKYQWR